MSDNKFGIRTNSFSLERVKEVIENLRRAAPVQRVADIPHTMSEALIHEAVGFHKALDLVIQHLQLNK